LSGLTEILLILLIVVVLFFLPRLVARSAPPVRKVSPQPLMEKLSGRWRLVILASVVWPAAMAMWLQPWTSNRTLFMEIGVAPVIVCWGMYWVISGFRKHR
jgi:hypothetical protein